MNRYIYRENETPEQRKKRLEQDQKDKEALRKRNAGSIRCYGAEGFVSRTIQEDGTVKEQYHYGVDGG